MKQQVVIFIGDGVWRAAAVSAGAIRWIPCAESSGDLPQRAAQLRGELLAAGCAPQPLLLAIPSNWCLNARISTDKLGRGNRHDALAFRLEEHLPASAEDFIADYVEFDDGTALGVCSDAARLRACVDAFEGAGLAVAHICPLALLAAAHAATGNDANQDLLLRCQNSPGCDYIEQRDGKPAAWRWFSPDDPSLQHLAASAGSMDAAEEPAARQAAKILEGTAWPPADFRRGALAPATRLHAHRAPLKAVFAALMLLFVSLALAAQWRASRYQAISREQQQKQIEVHKRLFPDQRAPASVKSRLLAEQRKIAALSGNGDEETSRRMTASALVQLRDLLKGLSPELQLQIIELNFQPDLIRIEGQALSHVDAERIAAAVRQTGVFEADPPKTDTLKSGDVGFSLIIRPRTAAAPAKAGP